MLHISISDFTVSIIQTSKNILVKESVIALSRIDLPEGIVSGGKIVNLAGLTSQITKTLKEAYPKEIKDHEASLAISDINMYLARFKIDKSAESDLSANIISIAKNTFSYDPYQYENYYSLIEKNDTTNILFAAQPLHTLLEYIQLFKDLQIGLSFLTANPFAIFTLIKDMFNNEKALHLLYCDITKSAVKFVKFDKYGPLDISDKRLEPAFEKKVVLISEMINKYEDIETVILAGPDVHEYKVTDFSPKVKAKIVNISELLDHYLSKYKIQFDSGGFPSSQFAESLGLMQIEKTVSPPNFARDPHSDVVPKKEEPEIVPIIEYKKSKFNLRFSKFTILISTIFIAIILIISGLWLNRNNLTQLLSPKGELTPTPSITQTITPTPTINPSLKRSDVKIQVANGTDITGYAKEIADLLEAKGFSDVAKVNADKDDYTQSVVKIKEDKKDYLPLVVNDLEGKLGQITPEILPQDEQFDIIIILGKPASIPSISP